MLVRTQPLQGVEVLPIQRIQGYQARVLADSRLLGFDEHREPGESPIVKEAPESILAYAAATDMLVSIDAAPQRLLRVVGVKHPQSVYSDDAIERVERLAIPGFRGDVVARRIQVTGIKTDTNARRTIEVTEDSGEVFESIPERPPLTRGVLEEHRGLV
jgi:hypothetical protein